MNISVAHVVEDIIEEISQSAVNISFNGKQLKVVTYTQEHTRKPHTDSRKIEESMSHINEVDVEVSPQLDLEAVIS
ncbi:hypothetical protein Ahy_A04g019807 isoform B [Arachis hypogaea]|uniref:Uncharacterized protein n=1 Tax=Arachis hypogaea TaxID=3818 RepID=A0A445DGM2_ARAHY|nr:hypothetical protein Ahy_A04g019807 isoform B [Arachis hypogaea]